MIDGKRKKVDILFKIENVMACTVHYCYCKQNSLGHCADIFVHRMMLMISDVWQMVLYCM